MSYRYDGRGFYLNIERILAMSQTGFWPNLTKKHWVSIFLVLCTILIVVAIQGFEHARVNNFRDQSVQFPVIYKYADDTLFQGDVLLDASDSYVTFFYPALGYLSRYMSLEAVMFGLYIVTTLITISAVYTIGETLFPKGYVGLIAVMLWLAYLPNLGGDYIHSPFVTHSTMAISLVLWSVVLILRKQYAAAALLLGFTANINAMTALFGTFMWSFALLLSPREWSWKLIRIPLLEGLTALPVLVWRLSQPFGQEGGSVDTFVEIMRTRLWYAIFPLSLHPALWIGSAMMLSLFLYTWRFGKPTQHAFVWKMMLGIGLLGFIGGFFAEIIPVEFIMQLQLIRSAWLINFFIIFYIANMVDVLLRHNEDNSYYWAFGVGFIFAIPHLIFRLIPVKHPTPYELYADLKPVWYAAYAPLFEIVVVLAFMGLLMAVWRISRQSSENIIAQRYTLWIGMTFFIFSVGFYLPCGTPQDQLDKTKDWDAALTWIEANTPKDAKFFIPPEMDGFRMVAKRPALTDWKDGTVGVFNSVWVAEWYDLMVEEGFDKDHFSFAPLSQDQACAISVKYHVDYVLLDKAWSLEGTPTYENDHFAVMPIEDLECPEDQSFFGS